MVAPPASEHELMLRVLRLAGRDLAWVASQVGWTPPPDLRRHKGWIGQLLEEVLGASASSRALPDFPELGVEMKTLPLRPDGRPKESTYVCTAPLDGTLEADWASSWVCKKLSKVLWVPILGDGAPGSRRVGRAVLWSPDAEEAETLAADFHALAELIAMGELWQLSAHHGVALQLRPKAASSKDKAWVLGEEGEWVQDTPRGFYLRPSFTRALIQKRLRTA